MQLNAKAVGSVLRDPPNTHTQRKQAYICLFPHSHRVPTGSVITLLEFAFPTDEKQYVIVVLICFSYYE